MSLGLSLNGRYRGDTTQAPRAASEAFLARIEAWARQHLADTLSLVWWDAWFFGQPVLLLQLHPASTPLEILGIGRGRLMVSLDSSGSGPGYHQYVCEKLKALGKDLEISWDAFDPTEGTGDETGFFTHGDRKLAENAFLLLLRSISRQILGVINPSCDQVMLSLPSDHIYQHTGVVATVLGPRDEAWLSAVAQDPRRGIDILPWWEEGQGASYLLGRALCQMWTDLRWRAPLNEGERRKMQEVSGLLARAYALDPGLSYPFREWHEILTFLEEDSELAAEVAQKARETPEGPRIGYRRQPVRVFVGGSWSVQIPGAFAESLSDSALDAFDASRSLRLRVLPPEAREVSPTRLLELLSEEEGEILEHAKDPLLGRAVLRPLPEQEGNRWELIAYQGAGTSLSSCVIRCEDRQWAIDTWRSLELSPGSS